MSFLKNIFYRHNFEIIKSLWPFAIFFSLTNFRFLKHLRSKIQTVLCLYLRIFFTSLSLKCLKYIRNGLQCPSVYRFLYHCITSKWLFHSKTTICMAEMQKFIDYLTLLTGKKQWQELKLLRWFTSIDHQIASTTHVTLKLKD